MTSDSVLAVPGPRVRVEAIWDAAALTLVAIIGIALRIWTYRSSLGVPTSDEAVVGLMARHALHGDLTVFYWGQAYGGPLEAWLAATLFAVAGPSWVALRLVPILLQAAACVVVWRVGVRTIGSRPAAAAAALFWVWPPYAIYELVHENGFYGADVFASALLALLALRIVESPSRARVGAFGFTLGVAFWETGQIVPVAVPLVAWTVWRRREACRHAFAALVLAAVGASPWLVWNAMHGWASLIPHATWAQYIDSLRRLVSPLGLEALGLATPFSGIPLLTPRPLTWTLYAVLAALFVGAGWRARRRNASLLFAVVAAFPLVYALPNSVAYVGSSPRYLVVLMPLLALLAAGAATTRPRAVAIVSAGVLLSAITLGRMVDAVRSPVPVARAPRALSSLVDTLDALGIDRVYADYWIAYVLDFDTGERIVAVENPAAEVAFRGRLAVPSELRVRYERYQRTIRAASAARVGFVVFANVPDEMWIAPQLAAHGYRVVHVGVFDVFAPGDGGIPPRVGGSQGIG